jgi:predicted DNA-binding protein (MmcQ/YjbR family)
MIDIESFRMYCLNLSHVEESMPFGEDNLVFKIGGKIFALMSLVNSSANLKCNPERVEDLRESYHYILPGYHMNKKHWNTVMLDQVDDHKLLKELIDHSYQLVFDSLTKTMKTNLV